MIQYSKIIYRFYPCHFTFLGLVCLDIIPHDTSNMPGRTLLQHLISKNFRFLIQGIKAIPSNVFSVQFGVIDCTASHHGEGTFNNQSILSNPKCKRIGLSNSQVDLEFTGLMAATFAPLKDNG